MASSVLPSRLLIMPRVTRLSAPTQSAPDRAASARARCAHSPAAALSSLAIHAMAYVAIARARAGLGGSAGACSTVSLITRSASAAHPGLIRLEQVVREPLARPGTELRGRVPGQRRRPDVAQQLDRARHVAARRGRHGGLEAKLAAVHPGERLRVRHPVP